MMVNRCVRTGWGLAVVAGLASLQGEVSAATLEVTATVPNACTVNSGALEFGEYQAGPSAPQVQGSGTFTVDCSSSASVEIKLNGGLHEGAGTNTRAMKGSGDDFLDYGLFQAPGFSTGWAPGVGVPFSLISGSNIITVNGIIDESQTVPGGAYSDTVEITLTFN